MTDPLLRRTVELEGTRADDNLVPCVLSTDVPVDRGNYLEVLQHDEAAVDLSRSPLPLIESHDASRVNVGIVEQLRVAGGKLRGLVRFGTSARGRELLADVKAGIVRGLSIGYRIDKTRLEGDTLIATRWTPFELSACAVPADIGAGFYRGNVSMTTDNVSGERDRVREILALGRLHNRVDDAEQAISEGMSLDQFRSALLTKLASGHRPMSAVYTDMTGRERDRYSILRVARALADPRQYGKDAGFEGEVSRTLAQQTGREARGFMVPLELLVKRDLTTSTGTGTAKSGYLVPSDLMDNEFADVLHNALVCGQAGARVLPGLVGNVTIPKRTAGATAAWIAEGNAASEGSNTFTQLTMSPKTVSAWLDVTRRLTLQSTPAVEQLVRADLIAELLGAVDAAAFGGSVTNGPTGLRATSGLGSVSGGTNGLAMSWGNLAAMVREVAVDNALTGSLAFVTNEKVRCKLAQTPKQSSGIEGNFILSEPDRLFGYKFLTTGAVASNLTKGSSTSVCSAMFFGNWNDLLIGLWSGVDIIVDTMSQSTTGTVRLVAFQDADICVKRAESFSACLDILTT